MRRRRGAEGIAGAVYPVAAVGDPMAPFPTAATTAQLHGSSRITIASFRIEQLRQQAGELPRSRRLRLTCHSFPSEL
ncbi:hypothetical protein ZWY2020_038481 [Hordeum vulgare]|nr:hypothetical protein ZWY2020_038481 [Hordeum vulgare]